MLELNNIRVDWTMRLIHSTLYKNSNDIHIYLNVEMTNKCIWWNKAKAKWIYLTIYNKCSLSSRIKNNFLIWN